MGSARRGCWDQITFSSYRALRLCAENEQSKVV